MSSNAPNKKTLVRQSLMPPTNKPLAKLLLTLNAHPSQKPAAKESKKLTIQIPDETPCPQVRCFSTHHVQSKPPFTTTNQQAMIPKLIPSYKISVPNSEQAKFSNKKYGIITCYAANTNQGLVRNYNEDRISIILNILKPQSRQIETWPKCSYFGVYDGHGGSACADYLRDRLHQFIIKEPTFPCNPAEALKNGYIAAEKKFMEICQNNGAIIDKSGSCSISCLIVDDMCYVANVGDSRAVLSMKKGATIIPMTKDHKPCDEEERKRIAAAGGKIYQTSIQKPTVNGTEESIIGPYRVLPGRLSVSRTFGDVEAKVPKYGGNPKVIICEPEIRSFRITKNEDFLIIASMKFT